MKYYRNVGAKFSETFLGKLIDETKRNGDNCRGIITRKTSLNEIPDAKKLIRLDRSVNQRNWARKGRHSVFFLNTVQEFWRPAVHSFHVASLYRSFNLIIFNHDAHRLIKRGIKLFPPSSNQRWTKEPREVWNIDIIPRLFFPLSSWKPSVLRCSRVERKEEGRVRERERKDCERNENFLGLIRGLISRL